MSIKPHPACNFSTGLRVLLLNANRTVHRPSTAISLAGLTSVGENRNADLGQEILKSDKLRKKIRRQKRRRSRRAKEKILAGKHHQSQKKEMRKVSSKDW